MKTKRVDIKVLRKSVPEKDLVEVFCRAATVIMDLPQGPDKVRRLKELLARIEGLGGLDGDHCLQQLHREVNVELMKYQLLGEIEDTIANGSNAADEVLPHFGLSPDEQKHWADVYHRLVRLNWLVPTEVSSAEWVYVCCGARNPISRSLVWYGANNALAFIIRNYFNGNWEVAHRVFMLSGNEPLPVNLKTANPPSEKTCNKIREVFS